MVADIKSPTLPVLYKTVTCSHLKWAFWQLNLWIGVKIVMSEQSRAEYCSIKQRTIETHFVVHFRKGLFSPGAQKDGSTRRNMHVWKNHDRCCWKFFLAICASALLYLRGGVQRLTIELHYLMRIRERASWWMCCNLIRKMEATKDTHDQGKVFVKRGD